MISEQIEFQISQYVDGTLSLDEQAAVDQLLAVDGRARKILADYRKLNAHLAKLNVGPSVHWDRLSEHLSAGVDRATAPVIAGRIGQWSSFSSKMRIAAAILFAASAWMIVRHHGHSVQPVTPQTPVSRMDVSGPQPEVANGPTIEDVQVKPSQLASGSNATRYGEGVIDHGPSKVVISGITPSPRKDSPLH
jgi:anti-sigma factor RsiW